MEFDILLAGLGLGVLFSKEETLRGVVKITIPWRIEKNLLSLEKSVLLEK